MNTRVKFEAETIDTQAHAVTRMKLRTLFSASVLMPYHAHSFRVKPS